MQLDEFYGADFKYGNIIFKFQPKKYPNKAFLVPNWRILIFAPNLETRQIWGRWFEMTIVFSNSSPKIRRWSIFGPKFKDFNFCTNTCNKAKLRALISNMTMVFQNCCPKHLDKVLLLPNLRIFIFALLILRF